MEPVHVEQFYLSCLAHASYMIASQGVAAVIDPQRDVDIYLEAAERLNVKIEYIIETHVHADFVSGHRELAERTGAHIYLGAGSGAEFLHVAVTDGDEIEFGGCSLRFLHTPGHTLESVCILMKDRSAPERPLRSLRATRSLSATWAGRTFRRPTRRRSWQRSCTGAFTRSC
jgi:glyoxylase-like metal-dependent hydrolase (beta-lactamase superfamily II)